MASVHDKERTLEREISGKVEEALPGVEVLAVELTGPERMTVYVDRAGEPVDHRALRARHATCSPTTCASTAIDVSSPGPERPLRKPRALPARARPPGEAEDRRAASCAARSARRRRTRVTVAADGGEFDIPYDADRAGQPDRGDEHDQGDHRARPRARAETGESRATR